MQRGWEIELPHIVCACNACRAQLVGQKNGVMLALSGYRDGAMPTVLETFLVLSGRRVTSLALLGCGGFASAWEKSTHNIITNFI